MASPYVIVISNATGNVTVERLHRADFTKMLNENYFSRVPQFVTIEDLEANDWMDLTAASAEGRIVVAVVDGDIVVPKARLVMGYEL